MASKNNQTCSDIRTSASRGLEQRVLQLVQTMLSSEWDWTTKKVSDCSKSNTKQLLHGINRNPGRSNWGLHSTTTSSLATSIWTWSTYNPEEDFVLVSSVFDPIGLFAPFSGHMRRLLKDIWTNNVQYWDNEAEFGDEEEFLRWKQQFPIVAETSIDRRYFNSERDKTELHVFADASEDTMCAVAYLRSQPK